MANNNICGSGIPSDEVWYKANEVTYPFRPYNQGNTWFNCSPDGTGSNNYILSNTYDSTDGWYKIKWSCDFVRSAGSGWYMQLGITEVIYPDCFEVEDAECWNYCTGITKITYGNSVTELGEGACPPNVRDIYMYTTTPPDLNPSQDQRGDYFRYHSSSRPITLHLPYGSDWSGVTLPNYVTVVYDLCDSPTPTPTNIVYPDKWKVGTDTTVKAYSGSNEVKKMYIGENLVYREQTKTPTPTTPTNVDYVHTSTSSATANYINTGIYPTTDTVMRIVFKPNTTIGNCIVGYDFTGAPDSQKSTPTRASSDDTDYRLINYLGTYYFSFDFNTSRLNKQLFYDSDGYCDVTLGNNYITDNISQDNYNGLVQSNMATNNVPIYLNVSSDSHFQSLEIWQNNVKVYDAHAAVLNGVYGVYDSVGGTFTTETYGGNSMTGGNL